MSAWIDFKELRSKLDFERILEHYHVEVKRKGEQHMGYCPLPGHRGKKNSVSFSANLKRGIFQCFGCGAKGNLLDFAGLMENVDPRDGAAMRKVALTLQTRFCPEMEKPGKKKDDAPKAKPPQEANMPVVINAPLDFELKQLDQEHPYLASRGFSKETIARFGLGFCSRGLLKNRIAIPLHDPSGILIGYAGRLVDDAAIGEDNPKYRFPPKRERNGIVFEFRKSLFLYNGHRLKTPLDDLVVVEGFPSVWWLTQLGKANVISTMGASVSETQAAQIVSLVNPSGRIWIVSDGDAAGERWAHEALTKLAPERLCRWLKLADAKQPTDYPADFYAQRMTK